jgi:hypothetical protein
MAVPHPTPTPTPTIHTHTHHTHILSDTHAPRQRGARPHRSMVPPMISWRMTSTARRRRKLLRSCMSNNSRMNPHSGSASDALGATVIFPMREHNQGRPGGWPARAFRYAGSDSPRRRRRGRWRHRRRRATRPPQRPQHPLLPPPRALLPPSPRPPRRRSHRRLRLRRPCPIWVVATMTPRHSQEERVCPSACVGEADGPWPASAPLERSRQTHQPGAAPAPTSPPTRARACCGAGTPAGHWLRPPAAP